MIGVDIGCVSKAKEEKLMKIAVDIGYSSVKGVSEHGRVMFPSVVAPASEDLLAGVVKSNIVHRVHLRRTLVDVEEHLVGDAAVMSALATSCLALREKPDAMHDILLLTAAYLLSPKEQAMAQMDLAIGLPISYYRSQRPELIKRLNGYSEWISVNDGREICLQICKISVFPQGSGALISSLKSLNNGLVALLDIGSYTTDYLVFDVRQGQPVPIPECCGSIEAGVSLVTRALADEFQRQTGAPLPSRMYESVLERVLAGESLIFQGRPVEQLDKALAIARGQVGNLIASNVTASLRDRAGFVVQTLIGGGGALLFKNEMIRAFPCSQIVDDPVFANAKGFLDMIPV